MTTSMKRYKVSWEIADGTISFRDIKASSTWTAMANVEKEIGGEAMGRISTMLPDGFITMFEVKEI